MTQTPHAGSIVPPRDWLAAATTSRRGPGALFLLVLTLLAAGLRLYGLTTPSLWVDEILTWRAVRPGLEFWEQMRDTIQGPLYMAVVWPLVRWQDPVLMMRLPAAVAGIATVPLFGVLAGRLVGRRATRLAVLLLAISPFHIWYSQEGRGYAFLMLAAVLAGLAYLELAARPDRRRLVVGFVLAAAACALSNLSGLFLLSAMALSVFLLDRPAEGKSWWVWFAALGGAVLLVLPWLLQAAGIWAVDRIVPGAGIGTGLRGETTFSPWALPYTLFTFGYGYSLGPSLREWHQPDRVGVLRGALPILAAGGLTYTVACLAGLWRLDRRRLRLLIWTLVPMLILAVLAWRNIKPWNARYVAVVFPFVLLLAASGLVRLPRILGAGVSLLLVGLTLWSLVGHYTADRYTKADVGGAARIVAAENAAGEAVLVPVVSGVFAYYYEGQGELLDTDLEPVLTDAAAATAFVQSKLAGRKSCWVVLGREWFFDPGGHLPVALARAGHLRPHVELPGVRIFTWRRALPTGNTDEY